MREVKPSPLPNGVGKSCPRCPESVPSWRHHSTERLARLNPDTSDAFLQALLDHIRAVFRDTKDASPVGKELARMDNWDPKRPIIAEAQLH